MCGALPHISPNFHPCFKGIHRWNYTSSYSYYFQNTRKGGRKRITRNSTIHTPCHHFTPVRQQFLTLFPGLCPWIKQSNDPYPRKMATLFLNVSLCKAWDERKAGRKRITRNSTIHTPCHHFTPVHRQFLTLLPGLCPWIKQTNDPFPLENWDIIYEWPPM